jgi:hypothetical protein
MKIPGPAKASESTDNASLSAWIAYFLADKPLSSVSKINEWKDWAIAKVASGWTQEAVKKRIREAWVEWVNEGNVDMKPMTPELLAALKDVYNLAYDGGSPAQCAVVYRSLARQYPNRMWIEDAALHWEAMNDRWSLTHESNG